MLHYTWWNCNALCEFVVLSIHDSNGSCISRDLTWVFYPLCVRSLWCNLWYQATPVNEKSPLNSIQLNHLAWLHQLSTNISAICDWLSSLLAEQDSWASMRGWTTYKQAKLMLGGWANASVMNPCSDCIEVKRYNLPNSCRPGQESLLVWALTIRRPSKRSSRCDNCILFSTASAVTAKTLVKQVNRKEERK